MNSKAGIRSTPRILLFTCLSSILVASLLTSNTAADKSKPSAFEIRRVLSETNSTAAAETLPFTANDRSKNEIPLRVAREVLLDQSQVANAKTHQDPVSGQMEIQLKLTKTGAERFAKITKDSIGQRLAIISNGKILTAPQIATEIPGGNLVISGNLTPQEASDLAEALNARKK